MRVIPQGCYFDAQLVKRGRGLPVKAYVYVVKTYSGEIVAAISSAALVALRLTDLRAVSSLVASSFLTGEAP